ncbi:MAG: TolC family protein, partial [Bacteroidales bacterium]
NYLEQLTNLVNLAQIKGDTDFSLDENTANLYEKTKLFFTDTMLVSMSQNHPVLKSYDEKLAREKMLESLYKKQSNPEVFSYMTTSWESAYIPFSKNFNYNIGAGIRYTLPYWGGGSYHDRIAQSRIRSDQLQNSRMDAYLNFKREFDALVVKQKNKMQEIESNREIIRIANKSLDNIIIMYESGQESILNLLDAQTIVTKQKILYEQSIIEYLELIARINYVCGSDNLPF